MEYMEPKWMTIARAEIGVAEIPGKENNPRILEYFTATSYRPDFEDSWCSAFVSWVLSQAGMESTHSASARSYVHWGVELEEPKNGAIIVFWRGDPNSMQGHVGFYIGETETDYLVLGGNQGDKVCIAHYPKSRLLAIRYPKEK
jgi:uncharacterized protein (TIGR02594 family)